MVTALYREVSIIRFNRALDLLRKSQYQSNPENKSLDNSDV